jgi:hypothetical protein
MLDRGGVWGAALLVAVGACGGSDGATGAAASTTAVGSSGGHGGATTTSGGGGAASQGGAGGATTPAGGAGGATVTETGTSVTPEQYGSLVDEGRVQGDLAFVTGERTPGSAHWKAVQDRCASVFTAAGLDVELYDYGTGVDVVGVKKGGSRPDERVLVGAHYDHIAGCAGADDNATGVADVLEAARVLTVSGPPFARTLVLVCFDEEETGYLGSKAFAARAASLGEKYVHVTVLDMIGYASDAPGSQEFPDAIAGAFPDIYADVKADQMRGDFLLVAHNVIATKGASLLEQYVRTFGGRVERAAIPPAYEGYGDLRRSDHAAFWDHGYPALSAGDTAEYRNPYYHCKGGEDSIATLNVPFLITNVKATIASTAALLAEADAPATTCADLCAGIGGATPAEISCAAGVLDGKGYPVGSTKECAQVASAAECSACVAALGVTDVDCGATKAACF